MEGRKEWRREGGKEERAEGVKEGRKEWRREGGKDGRKEGMNDTCLLSRALCHQGVPKAHILSPKGVPNGRLCHQKGGPK